ncbi:MAG: ester cyclase [Rhodobacteraceae bacterium]|nr:ester cyclase [Paracoccaceae bacterium]
MTDLHLVNKGLLTPLRDAQYHWDDNALQAALNEVAQDALVHLCHPFGDIVGGQAFFDLALSVVRAAFPDLERRDWIIMSGSDEQGADWVGCAGHFVGTFCAPFLDIPPTGHLAHMRFHEFYRIVDGTVAEIQAIWDIPEVMMQAGAWPLAPSLGRELWVPGPASGDGLFRSGRDLGQSQENQQLVIDMLTQMTRHPSQGGAEVMQMERFWHRDMTWYGPAGIGTARGIAGFRNWHQIPFLRAMPDRGLKADQVTHHFFADNSYCGVTGWPNMIQTVTQDGWLGIVPPGREIALRSLDFWRIERGKIRENWVLVDILDAYRQLGLDVFARLREFNKARVSGRIPFPVGDP